MQLSVVTTLYRSQVFLERFISKMSGVLQELGIDDYEIVAVNDGSPDRSLETMFTIKESNPHIVIVDLSRNFGHHYAMLAGLSVSKGEYVFTIDCDLEVDPSVFREFWKIHLQNPDAERVYGVQEKRKGGFIEKMGGRLFYRFFNFLSDTEIPENILTESLMSRQFVQELVRMGDVNLFLGGMYSWLGFKQIPVVCPKGQRETKSTYSFGKRVALSLQAVTSFSAYPLRLLFIVGSVLALFSFLFGLYIVLRKLFMPEYVLMGYSSLILVILFSTGVIIMSLGIIGVYIEKLFNQTKNRQRFIIKSIYP